MKSLSKNREGKNTDYVSIRQFESELIFIQINY